jgi:hypothetical protein
MIMFVSVERSEKQADIHFSFCIQHKTSLARCYRMQKKIEIKKKFSISPINQSNTG